LISNHVNTRGGVGPENFGRWVQDKYAE
jgi:hypothetical protein